MSGKNKESMEHQLVQQGKSFLEKAKDHNFNKKDAAILAGSGLVVLAGFMAVRKLGNKVRESNGKEAALAITPTEYMDKDRAAGSVVFDDGSAVSVPLNEMAAEKVWGENNSVTVFAVESDGRVIRGAHNNDPQYSGRVRRVIEMVQHTLPSFMHGEQDPEQQ